jgi:hypothetical protein
LTFAVLGGCGDGFELSAGSTDQDLVRALVGAGAGGSWKKLKGEVGQLTLDWEDDAAEPS